MTQIMARFSGLCGLIGCIGLLAACTGPQLGTATHSAPPPADFDNALYAGYLDLSQSEYGEQDVDAGRFFADRAVEVTRGYGVQPQLVDARDLPERSVAELAGARNRLMTAFDQGAKTIAPGQAARAQVMFDCWMQEQEEDFQPSHISACQAGFNDAMANVEDAIRIAMTPEPEPEPVVEVTPAPTEPEPEPTVGAPMPGPFLVFFDFDKIDLTDEATAILRSAAQAATEWQAGQVVVIGHADRAGTEGYNMGLSNRRAMAVRDELERLGLSGAAIEAFGKGETEPLVPTPDGVREPQNRRASITLQ